MPEDSGEFKRFTNSKVSRNLKVALTGVVAVNLMYLGYHLSFKGKTL
jgi:hypothetical protein